VLRILEFSILIRRIHPRYLSIVRAEIQRRNPALLVQRLALHPSSVISPKSRLKEVDAFMRAFVIARAGG